MLDLMGKLVLAAEKIAAAFDGPMTTALDDVGVKADSVFKQMKGRILDIPNDLKFNVSGQVSASVNGGVAGGWPVFPQADGGNYRVTRPTLFLAGDDGPEFASFIPEGRPMPSYGGGGDIHINVSVNMAGSIGADGRGIKKMVESSEFESALIPAITRASKRAGFR